MPIIITLIICLTALVCVSMVVNAVKDFVNVKYHGTVKRIEEMERLKK